MSHSNLSLAVPGGATPTHKVLSKHPAKPGSTSMVAFSYNTFGVIRGYRDAQGFAWFVLSDVYKALGIPGGTSGARNRVKRDPADLSSVRIWVPNTVNPEASGYRLVQAVREGGMHAMLGASPLTSRADMRRWMTATAIPVLRSL